MLNSIILSVFLSLGSAEIAFENSVNETIYFDLINKSGKSIPLWIPGVMNPNLSPFSRSGVNLELGQKIYFKNKSKKHLLITVDASLNSTKVDVSALIKRRKEELGLK